MSCLGPSSYLIWIDMFWIWIIQLQYGLIFDFRGQPKYSAGSPTRFWTFSILFRIIRTFLMMSWFQKLTRTWIRNSNAGYKANLSASFGQTRIWGQISVQVQSRQSTTDSRVIKSSFPGCMQTGITWVCSLKALKFAKLPFWVEI